MEPMIEAIAAALRDDQALDAPTRRALLDTLRQSPSPALEAAALILDDHELLDAWVDTLEPEAPLRLTAFVQRDAPEVDEAIDEALERGGAPAAHVAMALVRSQSGWHHPRLVDLLEGPAAAAALALLLTSGEREAVVAHIAGSEDPLDALDALMPLLADYPALRDELLGDLDEPEVLALMSALDVEHVAQGALGGELDWEILTRDPALCATILRHCALPSWTMALALASQDEDELLRQLAAEITLVASWAYAQASAREDEAPLERLQALLIDEGDTGELNQRAEQAAVGTGLGWVLGLAGEGAERLFVEIAAHETLLALGATSPGIPGLVLTPTDADDIDLDAVEAMLLPQPLPTTMDPEARLAQLKTLLDLHRWATQDPDRFAELAARCAMHWAEGDDALLARAASGPISEDDIDLRTLEGLATLMAWAEAGEVGRLAELWGRAPWPQMVLVEDALFEALRRA